MEASDSKPKDGASDPAPAPPPPASTSAPAPASAPHPPSTEPASIPPAVDSVPELVPEAKTETEPKVEPIAEAKTELAATSKTEPSIEAEQKPTTEATTTEPKVEAASPAAPPADTPNPAAIAAPADDGLPAIQKEQEEFEGTVDVNNDIPTEQDLEKVGDLLVLDAKGAGRPFKDLYKAPNVAPKQLIIFIRHFFCGNCQEYLRTLSSSIKPDDLLRLPTPTFITVIGCGRPELIPMYIEATACPFPVYADPTRKLYDLLGMTRTWEMGAKPDYMHSSMIINSVQSIFQGLGSGRNALKGGDFKQVGGEFLFEEGECTWVHRMKTTRDHAEVTEIRTLLGMDGTRPPMRKKWSHDVRAPDKTKENRRSMSWGKFISKAKGAKEGNGATTPEKVEEEKKLVDGPTV